MITRPRISQNEWKTTEIGASKVGNFALFSCPGLLGPNLAWPLSYGLLDARDVLAVDDAAIEAALRLTASELKQAVEPAGAVALAGLLSPAFAALRDDPERPLRRVAAVVCGGNVDAGTLAAILAGGGD